jgi:hypothetical protein
VPDKRRHRGRKERRESHWLVAAIVAAVLTAIVAALITTHTLEAGWHDVTGVFRSSPSAHDRTIITFFNQVETSELWSGHPKVYPASETFIKRHYRALNPLEVHEFVPGPVLVPLEILVERAAVQPGKFVITYGRVLASTVLEPTKGPDRSVMVQLVPASSHVPQKAGQVDPVVYCRVPLEEVPVRPGVVVFAEGVAVASGVAHSSLGGLQEAVYMDCAAIAPPYGRCGHFPLPPVPEAFQHCGPNALRRYQEQAAREDVYPHEASEAAYIEPL